MPTARVALIPESKPQRATRAAAVSPRAAKLADCREGGTKGGQAPDNAVERKPPTKETKEKMPRRTAARRGSPVAGVVVHRQSRDSARPPVTRVTAFATSRARRWISAAPPRGEGVLVGVSIAATAAVR